MHSGSLVTSDSAFFSSRVVVSGVTRDCVSWSVGRELSGDLPAQVASASGLTQASGSIVWAENDLVDSMPTTPFNESSGWLPRRGNRVEIYAGDGVAEWRVFTGLIDASTGDVGGGFQSTIIDDRDKLEGPFRHDPLLRTMPPLKRASPDYRGVGLSYLYFVDKALRQSGFFATPPDEARQAVSVPAQSSMWPEVGVMTLGSVGGYSGGEAAWCSTRNSVDGVAVENVQNTYSPYIALAYGSRYRKSITVDPDSSGEAIFTSYFGDTHNVQLSVAGSRTVIARLDGVEVCRVSMGSAMRVSLLVEGDVWELRTNTGAGSVGTISVPTTEALSRVTVAGKPNSKISGIHACWPNATTKWDYTNFVPSAKYKMESFNLFGIIDASPSITSGTCFDVLQEISQATLSAMWIDELGVFTWAPTTALINAVPVRELNTADDILGLAWDDNLLGTRSKVVVKHRVPAISSSRWDNVLWFQGSSETLESSQIKTDFVSPGGDEDWVGPQPDFLILGEPGASSSSNNGWGSLSGAVVTDGETEEIGATFLNASISRVNADTYKMRHAAKTLPAGKKLELRYPSESSTIWARWLKQPFPIIRGFAKTQWADVEATGAPLGPSWAPALEHDAGPWLSRGEDRPSVTIGTVADFLAERTKTSSPTIQGLEVVPDPRLQLGDRVTIRSDAYMGAVLTGIITGISTDDSGKLAQKLSLRLTSLKSTFQTYDAWNEQYPGILTYDQWAGLSAMTYNQFKSSED